MTIQVPSKARKRSLSSPAKDAPVAVRSRARKPIGQRMHHVLTENIGVGKISHVSNTGHPGTPDRYKLILVEKGKIRFDFDRIPLEAKSGDLVFIKPPSMESLNFVGPGRTVHTWCLVRKRSMPPDLTARLTDIPSPLCLKSSSFAKELMNLLLRCPAPLSVASSANFERLALCLYYEFLRIHEAELGGRERLPAGITKVVTYLHDHLAEPLELAQVARAVGMTATHVIRLFRKHLNETPMRYLWNLRARRGSLLLRHTSLTVSEIAYQVGFQYPSHFSRMIKLTTGMSPKHYRNTKG